MKNDFFLILMLMTLVSCATGRPIKTHIEEIEFGSLGGFTGSKNSYVLSAGGRLSKVGEGSISAIKPIDKKVTDELLQKAAELNLYTFNEPGNVYSFVRIKSLENNTTIVWSIGSTRVDRRVTALYNELMALIN